MPQTYGDPDTDRDEPITITRTCATTTGCGEEMEITVHPDGTYEGALYFGEIEVPVDGAMIVTERPVDDPWLDNLTEVEWSETKTEEFWMHEECAVPEDYDPEDVEHSVAD